MEKNQKILGSAMLTCIAIGVIVTTLALSQTGDVVVKPVLDREWKNVPVGDGDPGAGNSGVLKVFLYAHTGSPATTYNANISSGYFGDASSDTLDANLGSNVPYDTAFDIVVKVRYNTTHAYNTTGSSWEMDWVMGKMTSSDLSIGADTTCEEQQIATNDDYMWVHYYLQDSDGGAGSGFTISHGESVNVTDFTMQAYY